LILTLGWHTGLAYRAKGFIRRLLMLGAKPAPLCFRRRVRLGDRDITISTTIKLDPGTIVRRLMIGDEFHVRYVPQSRYFQPQEFEVSGRNLTMGEITDLNNARILTLNDHVSF